MTAHCLIELAQRPATFGLSKAVSAGLGHSAFERLAQHRHCDRAPLGKKLQYGLCEDVVPHGFRCLFKGEPVLVKHGPRIGVGHRMRPSVGLSSGGDRHRGALARPPVPIVYHALRFSANRSIARIGVDVTSPGAR